MNRILGCAVATLLWFGVAQAQTIGPMLGVTNGATVITGGTNKRFVFDDNGRLSESAGLTYDKAGSGTVTGPDAGTWTSAGVNSLVSLGVGDTAPGAGRVTITNTGVTSTTLGINMANDGGILLTRTANNTGSASLLVFSFGQTILSSSSTIAFRPVGSASVTMTLGTGGSGTTAGILMAASMNITMNANGTIFSGTGDAASATGGAVQIAGGASVAKRFWIPAISTSAALQTAVLCQSSGGEMIADSIACLASSGRFKNIYGPMQGGALAKLAALPIERWSYKAEGIFHSAGWERERLGPIAEDVAKMDSRLAGYDADGKVRTYSTEQLLAFTIKAIQELKADNDNLWAEFEAVKRSERK